MVRRRFNKLRMSRLNLTVLAVAILLALAFIWYFKQPSHRSTATIPSKSPTQSTTSEKGQAVSNSSSPTSTTSNNKSSAPTAANATLIAPWGSFVSNHHPGGGSPTTETSVCNTTPGATCYIMFTNGSLTRNLDAKTADANGSVIWNWDFTSAGFTSGSWQITAVATLGSQSKSVNDSQELVIQ